MKLWCAAVLAASVWALVGCSPAPDQEPETTPVDPGASASQGPSVGATEQSGRSARLGSSFTIAWDDMTDGSRRNVTYKALAFRCGKETDADVKAGAAYSRATYGEFADPAPAVEAGYRLCVATFSVANTGKKKLQHQPRVVAVDASGVAFSEDEGFTRWVGSGATRGNKLAFGSDTVELNPRQTGKSAVAFLIPLDTKVATLQYQGDDYAPVYEEQTVSVPVGE